MFHLRPSQSLCALVILATWSSGCSDSEGGDGALPSPCPAITTAGAPVVALDWDALVETHLAPDATATALALDYFVFPPHAVNVVRLDPDFDPALDLEGAQLSSRCPQTLEVSTLTRWLDSADTSGDVISAAVVAAHGGTSLVRRGRVTLAQGNRTLRLDTSSLASGDRWWFLFEPGRGTARTLIMPISDPNNPPPSEFVVSGLPRVAATVALVRTDALSWDEDNRVAYSDAGFSAGWRSAIKDWHGAVLRDWEEDDPVELPEIALEQGIGIPSQPVALDAELTAASTHTLLRFPATGAAGNLTVPCGSKFEVHAAGFIDVTVERGSTTASLAPGESEALVASCASGETSALFTVTGTALNGRTGFAVAKLGSAS